MYTIKKLIISTVAATSIFALVGNTTFANTTGNSSTTAEIQEGEFKLTAPNTATFNAEALNGATQTLDGTFNSDLVVKDASGLGAGWELSVYATQLEDTTETTLGKPLPLNSLTLAIDKNFITASEGSSLVEELIVSSDTIDKGNEIGYTAIGALADKGMGTYTVPTDAYSLKLDLKAGSAYKGTYTTTITWNLTPNSINLNN